MHALPEPWDCTVPELFEFAGNGGDGHMFGYVVHAPELQETDYPLAELYPGDPDSLRYFGRYTVTGFSNYLADTFLYNLPKSFSFWKLDKIVALLDADPSLRERLQAYGLDPDQAHQNPIDCEEGKAPVKVPRDWTFKPSYDGIGVLAPTSLFDENISYERETIRGSDYRFTASECIRKGKYATALLLLRDGYHTGIDRLHDREINLLMSEAYEFLDRPLLAQRTRQRYGDHPVSYTHLTLPTIYSV